jgi:hypothetical protein
MIDLKVTKKMCARGDYRCGSGYIRLCDNGVKGGLEVTDDNKVMFSVEYGVMVCPHAFKFMEVYHNGYIPQRELFRITNPEFADALIDFLERQEFLGYGDTEPTIIHSSLYIDYHVGFLGGWLVITPQSIFDNQVTGYHEMLKFPPHPHIPYSEVCNQLGVFSSISDGSVPVYTEKEVVEERDRIRKKDAEFAELLVQRSLETAAVCKAVRDTEEQFRRDNPHLKPEWLK